jgi:hypothetical protein
MFGKVKRYLGIEGVKVRLEVPLEIEADAGALDGIVWFESMHEQTVTGIEVSLIEKYKRGRRKNKLIDEFLLGSIAMDQSIQVKPDEPVSIQFSLPFEALKSDIDRFGDRNMVTKGLAGAAKFLKNARSEYRIEAHAKVKGTGLHPFVTAGIKIV